MVILFLIKYNLLPERKLEKSRYMQNEKPLKLMPAKAARNFLTTISMLPGVINF